MRITGAPAVATTSAMSGSCVMAETSLTIAAPAPSAARAVAAWRVSIETGPRAAAASTAGRTLRRSSSGETGTAPGRVDSPPTSRMSAPRMASTAASSAPGAARSPPSEKLSGVAFRIPISRGRSSVSPARGARGAVSRSSVSPGASRAGIARGGAPRSSTSIRSNHAHPPASGSAPGGGGPKSHGMGR